MSFKLKTRFIKKLVDSKKKNTQRPLSYGNLPSPDFTPLSASTLHRLVTNNEEAKPNETKIDSKDLTNTINTLKGFIDKFDGEKEKNFDSWFKRFYRQASWINSSDEIIFKSLMFFLSGKALLSVEAANCKTWQEINKILGKEETIETSFSFHEEIREIIQGELDIFSFSQQIKSICDKYKVYENKIMKDYFIRGLKSNEMKNSILLYPNKTFNQVVALAENIEKKDKVVAVYNPTPKVSSNEIKDTNNNRNNKYNNHDKDNTNKKREYYSNFDYKHFNKHKQNSDVDNHNKFAKFNEFQHINNVEESNNNSNVKIDLSTSNNLNNHKQNHENNNIDIHNNDNINNNSNHNNYNNYNNYNNNIKYNKHNRNNNNSYNNSKNLSSNANNNNYEYYRQNNNSDFNRINNHNNNNQFEIDGELFPTHFNHSLRPEYNDTNLFKYRKPFCDYCKREGHSIDRCRSKQFKKDHLNFKRM